MLTVPTLVLPSLIQGLGCFAGVDIEAGSVVWELREGVDRVTRSLPYIRWERVHGYLSTRQPNTFVLPRDNAGFINFAEEANLREGEISNGEPVLVAARFIPAGQELTVPFSSDGDAEWKMLS